MTRTDYAILARAIETLPRYDDGEVCLDREGVAKHIAGYLSAHSQQFDYDKFIKACKGEV